MVLPMKLLQGEGPGEAQRGGAQSFTWTHNRRASGQVAGSPQISGGPGQPGSQTYSVAWLSGGTTEPVRPRWPPSPYPTHPDPIVTRFRPNFELLGAIYGQNWVKFGSKSGQNRVTIGSGWVGCGGGGHRGRSGSVAPRKVANLLCGLTCFGQGQAPWKTRSIYGFFGWCMVSFFDFQFFGKSKGVRLEQTFL